tara:strand:+ start:141 stop:431 length:291 start_codon:yes stop_codon:yes gene_type:complete
MTTPRIFDSNDNEILVGDRVVFTLYSNLYEGTVTGFRGSNLPVASVEYIDHREALCITYITIKSLKLMEQADRRRIFSWADGSKGFKTFRLRKETS